MPGVQSKDRVIEAQSDSGRWATQSTGEHPRGR
jgi:hypothetical protein